jgi:hypothetical protein
MLEVPGATHHLAKRLAMLANDRVMALAASVAGESEHAPEITGVVLGLMPHFVEKAIVTADGIPGDVSSALAAKFVDEFEIVAKMISNAGGFSSTVKKVFFNTVFHTMFRREYAELRPQVEKLWVAARERGAPPLVFMAAFALRRAAACPGVVETEERMEGVYENLSSLFQEVHRVVRTA